ncbi:stage V sporulation protein AD [Chengkuizengella axinellae]|uniref:Stage V sporulation protein AD n=1 Tax=Chengkuizengella axinellae TaxID=3064388 RepID=A0ABT9IVD2_9BACL|nr:stage V sporulation protein AD [Chengkuizengella sp. 2205SS18-9]MDP5273017.1 stage V sporulation protein AD [Chengkuizengella sp. 2205SS18-9]
MLQGHQSWKFENKPVIISSAAIVGPEEGKGPLVNDFDIIHEDNWLGQDSWEKAEQKFMEEAAKLAVKKASLRTEDIDFYLGGDLMNQIISSSFTARTLAVPYVGVFGACSTSMVSLSISSLFVNSGAANHVVCGACSHNSSVEKQFRYPTEYGSQKPPTAQYTVTGAGASVIAKEGSGPKVVGATVGKVVDMGITDPFNMGVAMAPAAVDTIEAHLRDFQITPDYYDLIVTGDLAKVGHQIASDLFHKHKIPIDQTEFNDCGLMIYELDEYLIIAGGSGCGCSAVVTYGHLMKKLRTGELNRILVVATGALHSPISYQQGESIPCIAHAVSIESEK